MKIKIALVALALSLTLAPAAAHAQVAVANPTYASFTLELDVDRPAAQVWNRIGGYCTIAEWLPIVRQCSITSGTDGEIGAVRSVANEVLVGKTDMSYTYTQTPVDGRPYNLYHGTLGVEPVSGTTSRIVYSIFFDNSMLADDAARERDLEQRRTMFTGAMANMKTLAEGGTVPPAPARGGRD